MTDKQLKDSDLVKEIKTASQIDKSIKQSLQLGKERTLPIVGCTGLKIRIRPNAKRTAVSATFIHVYTHPVTKEKCKFSICKYVKGGETLKQAKEQHTSNLNLIVGGICPLEQQKADQEQEVLARKNTVQKFIDLWRAEQQDKVKQGIMKQSSLDSYKIKIGLIEEHLGEVKVTDVSAGLVIDFIREVQKQNTNVYGLDTKQLLSAIMNIAIAERLIDHNPTIGINKALGKHKQKAKPALTKPQELAVLLNEIEELPQEKTKDLYNKKVLQLLALTFVRIDDLCSAKWCDIDLVSGYWSLNQMKADNRDDMAEQLMIPLAPQAIALLNELKQHTGQHEYVFYNGRRKKEKYHDRHQVNYQLNDSSMNKQGIGKDYQKGKGYQGVHCPHGFRACAKSLLKDLGYDEEATELQLGHKVLNVYGKSYSRMQLLDQRTEMMHQWANYLDEIKQGNFNQILHVNFKKKQQLKQA